MTAAQILERLADLDTDPVFLYRGMLLCYWCQDPVDMGFKHADDCPWGALRKRHKKPTQDPLPELVDVVSGAGLDVRRRPES